MIRGVRSATVAVMIGLVAAGCGVEPQPTSDPTGFIFVRDELGLLPADERAWAEDRLREIASNTGVYGVVLTAELFPDPGEAIQPILDDVVRREGEAVFGFCTPAACDLSMPDTATDALRESLDSVAPAPEPAPGQGLPPAERGLRAWVEAVGAIATVER